LTTAAVDRSSAVDVGERLETIAIEFRLLIDTKAVELLTTVAKSSLATISSTEQVPSPTKLSVAVDASANLDLTTVARITVAVLITVFALIVASTGLVVTTYAVENEVLSGIIEVINGINSISVKSGVPFEEILKTLIIESPMT